MKPDFTITTPGVGCEVAQMDATRIDTDFNRVIGVVITGPSGNLVASDRIDRANWRLIKNPAHVDRTAGCHINCDRVSRRGRAITARVTDNITYGPTGGGNDG